MRIYSKATPITQVKKDKWSDKNYGNKDHNRIIK